MKTVLLYIFILSGFTGYTQRPLPVLLKEANQVQEIFSGLPFFKDDYFPLDSMGIPGYHADSIRKHYQVDQMVSEDGSMVVGYGLHEYLLGLLIEDLTAILTHPNFSTEWAKDSLTGFQVILSPDGKLLNLVFDENTGGSYRSRVSFLAYYPADGSRPWLSNREIDSQIDIHPDGFHSIDTILTPHGPWYLLLGSVVGCNTCYEDYLQLIRPTANGMEMTFNLSVAARSWEEKIKLDERTHDITIQYQPDDLSDFSCPCNEEEYTWKDENPCICRYLWTGSGYEMQFQE
ncbi:MAG: hypothetical protein LPK80_11775 [Bacteroidota bacterium]|nr:hypothetical protein [Bacteroidota bacterium]MDX5427067.1 hypothetical protein [Bacteroidota bacterium]